MSERFKAPDLGDVTAPICHSGCLRHTTEDRTVAARDPSQFGLTPFGQIPSNPPAMLLCIYDLWESLVFLSPSDSFLNKLAYSFSFLFHTSFVA
jgi:hypothetical protein